MLHKNQHVRDELVCSVIFFRSFKHSSQIFKNVRKGVYVCYVVYIKAFDKVRCEEIITQETHLKIDEKDQRVIKNMY